MLAAPELVMPYSSDSATKTTGAPLKSLLRPPVNVVFSLKVMVLSQSRLRWPLSVLMLWLLSAKAVEPDLYQQLVSSK